MLPNIRVEQYEIKNQGTFDGAKWLTKYDVKIQFSDRDIAYAMKDRIDKFLQGEDYRAMYLKVRDELAELQQRTWVGLTDEELRIAFGKLYPNDIGLLELAENNKDYAVEAIGARHHWTAFKAGARAGEAKLKEKNS